jgi:hypothetical protein
MALLVNENQQTANGTANGIRENIYLISKKKMRTARNTPSSSRKELNILKSHHYNEQII